MKQIDLCGKWILKGRREGVLSDPMIELPATVPGTAQLELSEAGILPKNLYMGMNITETERFEDYEWWYERSFDVSEIEKRAFLVFRGVDCIAEYYLNGERIGESDNAFIPYEIDVSEKLVVGENRLTVHILSPMVAMHKESCDLFALDLARRRTQIYTTIRRPIHSYGWDIMPRAVSAGIWREVYLEYRDSIRITQSFFDFSVPKRPRFCFETESEWHDFVDVEIEVSAKCGESEFSFRQSIDYKCGMIDFTVPSPKLWWPYGYGEPNLYDAEINVYSRGERVHHMTTRFGIRTVELLRTDVTDGENGYFKFIVNGKEIMCRGSNWVPLDAFHSRDKARYKPVLELVKDIGCNILRCWGGNVYEDHEFFDFCDENGVMVWQDFAMACYTYPQTQKFYNAMYAEAQSIVREYRHHPSIILWSGDNECDYAYMTGRDARPSMNRITREILPEAVRLNDVGRPYLASSPYEDDSIMTKKGLYTSEAHLWGVRDYYKSDFYKQSRAHFVSETGYHGCPSLDAIKQFITPDRVWPYKDNSEWNLHSTDQDDRSHRVMLMENQVRQLFGEVPTDPERYIFASQVSQAEAKKYFIERVRFDRPRKSGIIWWNLMDGWPQMSDAVVGYYFDKKLAYYYIRRAQAPFAIVCDELSDNHIRLYACNDTLTAKRGTFRVYDAETGVTLADGEFNAEENTSTQICAIPLFYSDKKLIMIEWKLDKEYPVEHVAACGRNHYLCGFPTFDLDTYMRLVKEYKLDGIG